MCIYLNMRLHATPDVIDSMLWRCARQRINARSFKANFGASKFIAGIAFHYASKEAEKQTSFLSLEEHLLCLYWLKNYTREENCASWFRVSEKTFRYKYKTGLRFLSIVNVINFNKRLTDNNFGYVCKVSIDGTDCPICEPSPFSPRWYSHKFHKAGLRYEVGICIETGEIVWVFGGYACGDWPDIEIARRGILNLIGRDEKVIADSGYRGDDRIFHKTGDNTSFTARTRSLVRARHETVNDRLKAYAVLNK